MGPVCIVLASLAVVLTASSDKPYGAETPQAAAAGFEAAVAAGFGAAAAYLAPNDRAELARQLLREFLLSLSHTDPDNRVPGSQPLPAAEVEARRTNYDAAEEKVTAALEKHRLDGIIGKPVYSATTQATVEYALALTDTVVLLGDLIAVIHDVDPLIPIGKVEITPFPIAHVSGFKVRGESATAKAGKRKIDFVRLEGRWYLKMPAPSPNDFLR